MTRRSAYLLTWGIAYLALGLFLIEVRIEPIFWGVNFGVSGAVSLIASVTKYRWIDIAGFILLSTTAAVRAVWFMWAFFKTDYFGELFGVVLWVAVAIAQIIVAGWPEARVEFDLLQERETGGIE